MRSYFWPLSTPQLSHVALKEKKEKRKTQQWVARLFALVHVLSTAGESQEIGGGGGGLGRSYLIIHGDGFKFIFNETENKNNHLSNFLSTVPSEPSL